MWRVGIVMMGWLAIQGLTGRGGYAAACPQDSQEKSRTESSSKNETMPAEDKTDKSFKLHGEEPGATTALPHKVREFGERFLLDQKEIWTSPAHLNWSDANWLVPISGITAGLFVTDADMSRHISHNPTTLSHYNTLSDAAVGGLIGGAGAMWLLSYPKHNSHWRETGLLAGEAVVNSLIVVEGMKYPLGRERPFQGDGSGPFFHRGDTSFPSEHSAAAWAAASVVAHEYPGPLSKILVYSLASLVDYSRYRAHQHFPSDIFVGSLIGNMVAENVYNRHHDEELGGSSWEPFRNFLRQTHETSSRNMGSPYVPLDSWVYPAMDRLIAEGFIRSAMVDMRPWTRIECARLVSEASLQLEDVDVSSSQTAKIYSSLAQEFSDETSLLDGGENTRARMESVYTRFTEITGKPLSQGYDYDFGQTLINDFGRPYEQGFNDVTGFSGWATESYFTVYASGEFQHAPGALPLTASARQVISQAQAVPEPPGSPISQIDRFQLLDTYVGITLENWQITFGKQSLWWGPGVGGPMMFSDNSQPITMFRINRVSPFTLPSFLKVLGPWRIEIFLGQLSGQAFVYGEPSGLLGSWTLPISPQPMISGERFSFKPTPNVEFGFSATALFAGKGVPFNLHSYLKSILRFNAGGPPGTPTDAGDGRSGFDLSYRLPLLRNWATFYADGFSDDQFSPVAYWDRSAWTGGLYLSHFPKIPKLDLRLEGVYTDVPAGGKIGNGFFYFNTRFRSGYTENGVLLGNWIGRQGQGAQAWMNYWFTPKNRLQFSFRHEKVSGGPYFIPGGGTITDFAIRGDLWTGPSWSISASGQYESWIFPVIQPGRQTNFSTGLQLTFRPGPMNMKSTIH